MWGRYHHAHFVYQKTRSQREHHLGSGWARMFPGLSKSKAHTAPDVTQTGPVTTAWLFVQHYQFFKVIYQGVPSSGPGG